MADLYTFGELMHDLYSALGQLQTQLATGGSTTTAVSSVLVNQIGDTGYENGMLIVTKTTDGLAPLWEFQRIASQADSSGTFTVDTAFTAGIAAGDEFGYTTELYPFRTMATLASRTIQGLGDLYYVDKTTLDTAALKTEYATLAVWGRRPPFKVEIETNTTDADGNDSRWYTIPRGPGGWRWEPGAEGATGLLIFKTQPVYARNLKIHYIAEHPALDSYDDVINQLIHPNLAEAAVTYDALRWQERRLQGGDESLEKFIRDAEMHYEKMKRAHPIWLPKKDSELMAIPNRGNARERYIGVPGNVRL